MKILAGFPALRQEALRKERAIPKTKNYITFRGKESLMEIDDRLSAVAANLGKVIETEPL